MTSHFLPAALRSSFYNLALMLLAVVASFASISFTTGPAHAAGQPVFYAAELAAPVERQTEIISGIIWKCEGTRCVAPRASSRPDNVCKRLVRKFGAVSAFNVREDAFDPAALSACNDVN